MSKKETVNTNHSVPSFDDEVFIAHFRKHAHEYLEIDLLSEVTRLDERNPLNYSETGNQRIQKMIKKALHKENNRRHIKRLPRIAVVIIIFIVISSITVMSVEAFRIPFLNLFVKTEEKVTDIDIDENQTTDEPNNIQNIFSYIPDGYELKSEDIQEQAMTFIYSNDNQEDLYLYRFSKEGSLSIDTENADYNQITIDGYKGFYSIKNEEINFVYTKNNYAYMICGKIDLNESIKILENIE